MPDTADTDGAKPKTASEADTAEAGMQAYMLRHFYFCEVIKGLRVKEKRHFNGKGGRRASRKPYTLRIPTDKCVR